MQHCLRSTKEASSIPLTKQYRYGKQLHAGFVTCRVRRMFASNMPNSLPLLIHSINFSFKHKPQTLSVIYAPNCVIADFSPTCCGVAFSRSRKTKVYTIRLILIQQNCQFCSTRALTQLLCYRTLRHLSIICCVVACSFVKVPNPNAFRDQEQLKFAQ